MRAAAGAGDMPAAALWRGASAVERLLVERLIVDVVDDMGAYVRDAVEDQVEEVADIERGLAFGRVTRGLRDDILAAVLDDAMEGVASEAAAEAEAD